jgi:hypothetical protein
MRIAVNPANAKDAGGKERTAAQRKAEGFVKSLVGLDGGGVGRLSGVLAKHGIIEGKAVTGRMLSRELKRELLYNCLTLPDLSIEELLSIVAADNKMAGHNAPDKIETSEGQTDDFWGDFQQENGEAAGDE